MWSQETKAALLSVALAFCLHPSLAIFDFGFDFSFIILLHLISTIIHSITVLLRIVFVLTAYMLCDIIALVVVIFLIANRFYVMSTEGGMSV